MNVAWDLLVDVVKDTLAESLREADVIKAVRRSAIAYRYLSLASVGIECGIHQRSLAQVHCCAGNNPQAEADSS